MKKMLFSMAILSAVLFSCKNSSKDANQKYSMSKGMVKYTIEVMGMNTTSILWFDEFGAKECMETSAEIMGMKSNTRSFKKDGFAFNINMDTKTGTKIKIAADQFDPSDMQFEKMSPELKKKYNLKEEGSEKFLDKDCKIYSMDFQGSKGKFWVWDNIAMKYEMSQGPMTITMKAVEISENPTFPESIFEIPAGVTITETNMDDAMKGTQVQ